MATRTESRVQRTPSPAATDSGWETGSSDGSDSSDGTDSSHETDSSDEEYDDSLLDAAKQGERERVARLLQRGAKIQATNKNGETALHCAACNGHKTVVEVLLDHDAGIINETDDDEWTALYGACTNGHTDVVELLLQHEAKIDLTANDGWTVLHTASYEAHDEVVTLLLEHDASTSAAAKNGETAVHLAARQGNTGTVELLLKKDPALIDAKDEDGWPPLFSAVSTGREEAARFLVGKCNDNLKLNEVDKTGWNLLHLAAHRGYLNISKILLEGGAEIDIVDKEGWSSLHKATSGGHKDVVILLLEKNANIDLVDLNSWSPLHKACSDGNEEVVQVLLDRGPKIDFADNQGWTALHKASNKGYIEIVRMLIKSGANIDLADTEMWTSLHKASSRGYDNIVELLLEHGASPDLTDSKSWTAMHKACNEGNIEIVKLLLKKNASIDLADKEDWTALHKAVSREHEKLVELLLEKGANVNLVDNKRWTPLQKACTDGNPQIARLLLKWGASIDLGDRRDWTALHRASTGGFDEVVKMLLEHEASIDLVDNEGWTALHKASSRGYEKVVELLLKSKAAETIKTNAGKTALHLAAYYGHRSVVAVMLKDTNSTCQAETNNDGDTALHIAIQQRQYAVVSLLVQKMDRAGKEKKNHNGITALSLAAKKKSPETLRLLLENMTTADFGEETSLEEKTLIWAAQGDQTLVKLLLEKRKDDQHVQGYEPDPKAKAKWTALHWATYYGIDSLVYRLLANGASAEDTNGGRDNAESVANDILEILKASDQSGTNWQELDQSPMNRAQTNSDEGKTKKQSSNLKQPSNLNQSSNMEESSNEKQPTPEERKYGRILNLLRNPPVVQGHSHLSEQYHDPVVRETDEETVCKEFQATIVDFYKKKAPRDSHAPKESSKDSPKDTSKDTPKESAEVALDFLRRSRPVYDIVYGDGPEKIMTAAREDLNGFLTETEMRSAKRYTGSDLGFRWIHLPATNMEWMNDLLRRVCKDKQEAKKVALNSVYPSTSKFLRRSWYELPGRTTPSEMMKPACMISPKEDEMDMIALYMPYLTFARHTPNAIAKGRQKRLIEAYEGKILHLSQSLDQFYYHSLPDTRERDNDQVVTRYIKSQKQKTEVEPEGMAILRVEQLWIWAIDDSTIITSSSNRFDDEPDPVLEGIYNHFREEKKKGQGKPPPSSTNEMVKFMANFCIGFIDQYTTDIGTSKKSAQEIFAITVNEKAVQEAALFNKFRCKIDSKIPKHKSLENNTAINIKADDTLSDKDDEDAANHPYESISVAAHLLEEVKDIRDELNILKTVVNHQKTVWNQLFHDESIKKIQLRTPDYSLKEIKEMDKAAERIQDSIKTLLDLDQNEANVSEAQKTTQQGRTLMVFTIVTIIFLPMSFLASLFALNITSFPHDDDGVSFDPQWIFPIIFGVSTAVFLIVAPLAFSWDLVKSKSESFRSKFRSTPPGAKSSGKKKAKQHQQHQQRKPKPPFKGVRSNASESNLVNASSNADTEYSESVVHGKSLGVGVGVSVSTPGKEKRSASVDEIKVHEPGVARQPYKNIFGFKGAERRLTSPV